jgi:hypothetical protein
MVEIIASLVLVGSIAGAGSILVRKMPRAIKTLEIEESSGRFGWRAGFAWLSAKIRQNPRLKDFSWLDFLQKKLLKIRVAVLKVDNKINDFAAKLRQRAEKEQRKDGGEATADNYWRDLKTIVKNKQSLSAAKKHKIATIAAGADGQVERADEDALPVKRVVTPEQTTAKVGRTKKRRLNRKKKTGDPFAW